MGLCCSSKSVYSDNIIKPKNLNCSSCLPNNKIPLRNIIDQKSQSNCSTCIKTIKKNANVSNMINCLNRQEIKTYSIKNNQLVDKNLIEERNKIKENNFFLARNFSFQDLGNEVQVDLNKSEINSVNLEGDSTMKCTQLNNSVIQGSSYYTRSIRNKTDRTFEKNDESKENYRYEYYESGDKCIYICDNEYKFNSFKFNESFESCNQKNQEIVLKREKSHEIYYCQMNHLLNYTNKGGICQKCQNMSENIGYNCSFCSLFYCKFCIENNQTIQGKKCNCEFPMVFYNNIEKCNECYEIKRVGKKCEKCKINICSDCLDLRISHDSCLCGNKMKQKKNENKEKCFSCQIIVLYGYSCDSCEIFNCCYCSKHTISNDNCFVGHKLKYSNSPYKKCFNCETKNQLGKICQECDYYICNNCTNLKITTKSCFCLNPLEFVSGSDKGCVKCQVNRGFGKGCPNCNIYLCYECSEMKLLHDKCLGEHDLIQRYSFQDFKCISCLTYENLGNFCDSCQYFICLKCVKSIQIKSN